MRQGREDKRYHWGETFRIIKEQKPVWIIRENVHNAIKQGLDPILKDLETEGFAQRTFNISASGIGARHTRKRIFTIAFNATNSDSGLHRRRRTISKSGAKQERKLQAKKTQQTTHDLWSETFRCNSLFGKVESLGQIFTEEYETNTRVLRIADGIPNRVDRIKGLGNAVVPQIIYLIGLAILQSYK